LLKPNNHLKANVFLIAVLVFIVDLRLPSSLTLTFSCRRSPGVRGLQILCHVAPSTFSDENALSFEGFYLSFIFSECSL